MLDPSIVSKIKIEKDGPVDIIRVNPGNGNNLQKSVLHWLKLAKLLHYFISHLFIGGVGWESENSQAHLTSTTHGLFGLLKSLDAHFSNSDGAVMSVSAMDGSHGNSSTDSTHMEFPTEL